VRLSFVATAAAMTARELGRRRLVLALALLVPTLFFGAVVATTDPERRVPIRLAAALGDAPVEVAERRHSLLFIGLAAAGLISAFFAAGLVQRQLDANRRLVLCGYRADELIAARVAILLGIVAGTCAYTWVLLGLVTQPAFPVGVLAGIALGALVYGGYGLVVGTVLRRDLESVLAILVLINIDAGWLQNPIYYESARGRWLIEVLPAHHPAQVAYLAAFTSEPATRSLLAAAAYGAALGLSALLIYSLRMRVNR
jgi:ABC-2 type transport system permease protein